jgi:hypothetical protein
MATSETILSASVGVFVSACAAWYMYAAWAYLQPTTRAGIKMDIR